jgi:hypothetical protein
MKKITYLLALIAAMLSCKKPYNPPAITSPGSYLVVEGVINTGTDSTIIKLSKTVSISSTVTTNPVLHATVSVESDQNGSYPLTETGNGNYVSTGLNLDNTRQYRLRISTPDNQQYLSDFVAVKVSPPIDSIGFKIVNNNMQVYVNTHDPNNNTHYYRWDYQETWEFHALYSSDYVSNGDTILQRPDSARVFYCYAGYASSSIVLGSSAKLKQDVIYQAPITEVASTSEKIEIEYSILVKQYALTGDAYNFWVNLRNNTEQLGSIFDAQPSNINGNIHNVANPSEPVIGYVSACTVQTKRVFIKNSQLPQTLAWQPVYPYNCKQDSDYYSLPPTGFNQVDAFLVPLPNSNIPTSAFYLPHAMVPSGFLSSGVECADCTVRGVTKPPAFWK